MVYSYRVYRGIRGVAFALVHNVLAHGMDVRSTSTGRTSRMKMPEVHSLVHVHTSTRKSLFLKRIFALCVFCVGRRAVAVDLLGLTLRPSRRVLSFLENTLPLRLCAFALSGVP